MGEQDGSTIRHSETIGSIAGKLSTVIGKIGTVKKSGWNNYDEYWYATDADIFDAVRGPLSESGIALVTGYEVTHKGERKTSRGGTAQVATVRLDILMADESGEWIRSSHTAEGEDRGDKAVPKAVTAAAKCWAKPTFLLSTGEDIENDTRQPEPKRQPASRETPQRKPQQAQQRTPAKKPTKPTAPKSDPRTERCERHAKALTEINAYTSSSEALSAVKRAAVELAKADGIESWAGITLEHIDQAAAALAEEMNQ
jgi:hypothetical protein